MEEREIKVKEANEIFKVVLELMTFRLFSSSSSSIHGKLTREVLCGFRSHVCEVMEVRAGRLIGTNLLTCFVAKYC